MRYASSNNVSALVLKAMGERKEVSFDDLRRITELLPEELQRGLNELQGDGFVELNKAENYALTDRGLRARYFVAS